MFNKDLDNASTIDLITTIQNNTRIIDSLTSLVMGFDYGSYDSDTIPDCMLVIGDLAKDAGVAGERLHELIHKAPQAPTTEG